jgi:hypothetical protein
MLRKLAILIHLGLFSLAATAANLNLYQGVIDQAAPGFQILQNADMFMDEESQRNFLPPEEIAERKKRAMLGVIEGRFNNDKFMDFAALVVNRTIKEKKPAGETQEDHFAARLVVCLGTQIAEKYSCEVLPTLWGPFINLPYQTDLILFKAKGEFQCGSHEPIPVYYPEGWKGEKPPGSPSELPPQKIVMSHDGIGEYAIGSNVGRALIRRSDGIYLDCAEED